jgi:hypothetical protein
MVSVGTTRTFNGYFEDGYGGNFLELYRSELRNHPGLLKRRVVVRFCLGWWDVADRLQ